MTDENTEQFSLKERDQNQDYLQGSYKVLPWNFGPTELQLSHEFLPKTRNPHAESQEVEKLATLTNIFSLRSLLSSQNWIGMQLAANRDSGTQAPSSSGLCHVSHMAFPGPCARLSLSSSLSHGETQIHMWDVFMGQMWQ